MPALHEVWTWQGDTSVLPYKVVEILNQVSIFDEADPRCQREDPFDMEIPFKAVNIKNWVAEMQRQGQFDPQGAFFITTRSQAVGCIIVLKVSENSFKLEYLASLSDGSRGIEKCLCDYALRFCL